MQDKSVKWYCVSHQDAIIQAKRVVANSTDFLIIAVWLQNGNHAAGKLVL